MFSYNVLLFLLLRTDVYITEVFPWN